MWFTSNLVPGCRLQCRHGAVTDEKLDAPAKVTQAKILKPALVTSQQIEASVPYVPVLGKAFWPEHGKEDQPPVVFYSLS